MLHVEQVKQPKRKPGMCACGKHWKRENQGNCYECHAKAQATYRRRLIIRAQHHTLEHIRERLRG